MNLSLSALEIRAKILLLLSNPQRLAILYALSGHEMPIGRLSQLLDIPASAVWQHLSKLRASNLVSFHRDGYTVLYRCDLRAVDKLLHTLNNVDQSEED